MDDLFFLMSPTRRSSQAINPVRFSQHILNHLYLLSCLHYRLNEWMNSWFSSTPPRHQPLLPILVCAQHQLWYYYAMHIITTAFACSQIKWPLQWTCFSLYYFQSGCFFRWDVQTNARLVLFVVARFWGNERDFETLGWKSWKVVYSPFYFWNIGHT